MILLKTQADRVIHYDRVMDILYIHTYTYIHIRHLAPCRVSCIEIKRRSGYEKYLLFS